MEQCDRPVRVYVCGRLAVERGPVAVADGAFPARQGRRVWAFLVLHRQQPVGREDLAVAVWGDAMPDAWDTALSAVVSRVRRCLRPVVDSCPDPAIAGGGGTYALALPPGSTVDFERAREALHRADVLVRREQWAEALAEARVAAEIAARGFLGGEGGPWVEGQRRLLADLRVHALEHTVAAELARGQAHTAEREAELLVALDPLRESAHQLLMRALAASGNRARAAVAYDRCRAILRDEVGIAPSPATERLYRAVIGGDPS